MQHAIIHYLLKKKDYNMIIKEAKDVFFKVHNKVNWKSKKIIDYILNEDLFDIEAIKLVGFIRDEINDENLFIEKLKSI
jgi:hypothetical protein